ncbi:MAG: glutaredoxin family protein [Sulfuricellaceae bacterium]|nr:glutaredoxin family protein [Sulfuricellaceae bacterium]
MKVWIALLCLVAGLTNGNAHAEVYKIVGADGKISYSDTPPVNPDTKAQTLKIQTWTGSPSVSTSGSRVGKVTILSAKWCGVCTQAKSYMKSHSIAFEEWDIDQSDFARSKMRELGAKGVPVILVGTQKMVGFSPERLESMIAGSKAQ